MVFIASDETLDRQGEVIGIDTWDLANFQKNPVLLVNHDYRVETIVGRAANVGFNMVDGNKVLTFEPEFHGLTQLSREVQMMVEQGILSTVSVGFLRRSPRDDGDTKINELMEISFVPVPANPSAERIRSIMSDQLSVEEIMAVKHFAGIEEEKKEEEEVEVKEGRVLSTKNRRLVSEARDALQALLDASEPEKQIESNASDEGETEDTPKVGQEKAKGRAGKSNSRELRFLKRVAKEINHAIYESKQTSNG